jgi:hypothetical protein
MKSHNKKTSKLQESRTAKQFQGRTQIASGALSGLKGDVRSDYFLIENKTTSKMEYIFKLSVWDKIKKEALRDNIRIPLIQLDMGNERDEVIGLHQYVIMDWWDFTSIGGQKFWKSRSKMLDCFGKKQVQFNIFRFIEWEIEGEERLRIDIQFKGVRLVVVELSPFLRFIRHDANFMV